MSQHRLPRKLHEASPPPLLTPRLMDSSDMDPDMASFMGFSSFGTRPAAKKRKYNHRTDAVSSSSIPQTSSSATGANQVALATRTSSAIEPPVGANINEIPLDSDTDDQAANEADKNGEDEGGGGASLYSDPAFAPALAHAQGLINELTTRGGVGSGHDANGADPQAQSSHVAAPVGLPQRPDASWGREMGIPPTILPQWGYNGGGGSSGGGVLPSRGSWGGRNQHQQRWNDDMVSWEGEYDPASNENPWEELEKAAGVESSGTWISRGQTQSA